MPIVKKDARYVKVGYELCCGFERAGALADDVSKILEHDKGFWLADDVTCGWEPDNKALVEVVYVTMADAIRLDAQVRELLSRSVDFTYEATAGVNYGSRGPTLRVDTKTSILTPEPI